MAEAYWSARVAEAENHLTQSGLIEYHYINDSITSTVPFTERPEGQSGGITFQNEGDASAEFLHSTALHVLVANEAREATLKSLEQQIPNLLALMEDGEIFGLLGAVDVEGDGPEGDYDSDIVMALMAVNPDLFSAFETILLQVAGATGLVSSTSTTFWIQGTQDVYDSDPAVYDSSDTDYSEPESTIKDFLLNVAMQQIREYARTISAENDGGTVIPPDGNFWGDAANTGVISNRFVTVDAALPDEVRFVYGPKQIKEIVGRLAFHEVHAAVNELFFENIVGAYLNDGVAPTGFMIEANEGNATTFDEPALSIQGQDNNFVFLGGVGADTFEMTMTGHSYVWGSWGGNESLGDTIDFSNVAVDPDDAGITLTYQPETFMEDYDVDGWEATMGSDPQVPTATVAFFDVEQIILTKGADNLVTTGDPNDPDEVHQRIVVAGLDGNDTMKGGANDDDIAGGLGNDSIEGGAGADLIFDYGPDIFAGSVGSSADLSSNALRYDPNGDDTINGGAGSDVLVYSGAIDTFEGGTGDDTYLTIDQVHATYGPEDHLTIVLQEDAADDTTWFGHDLILGDGRGVDLVQFIGISLSDVTISYDYEEVYIGSEIAEFDPLFWWNLPPAPATYDFYQTIGSFEIRVDATGSSIVVEQVIGYQVRGDNPSALGGIEASIAVPFVVEFSDGYLDWPGSILDPTTGHYTFENSDLSEDAFAARDAF